MTTMISNIKPEYSMFDKLELLGCLVKTKVIYRQARIIRRGFDLRGKRMIDLGTQLTTGKHCRIEAFLSGDDRRIKIKFGNRVQLNDYVHISSLHSVEIGDDVLVASHVYISDNSHGSYKGNDDDVSPDIAPIKRSYYISPVKIGDRVWLGEGVIVLPGVTIGEGAIIGAHAIVSSNIPPNSIAAGSPAKVIKYWDSTNKKWVKC